MPAGLDDPWDAFQSHVTLHFSFTLFWQLLQIITCSNAGGKSPLQLSLTHLSSPKHMVIYNSAEVER